MSTEYSVVWRWEIDHNGGRLPERRRTYKTEAGARRLLDKLRSNEGRYDKMEDGTGIQTGELVVEHLRLVYARLEWREVGRWRLHVSELVSA